jgi:hypothetical protein
MILLLLFLSDRGSGQKDLDQEQDHEQQGRIERFGFASLAASPYDGRVLELEVYASGVRDLNKILELDIELGAIAGLHYKVDRNHDIVYMELEAPTVTFRELRSIFRKLGLEPKFVGAIPAELRPKTKTQLLDA